MKKTNILKIVGVAAAMLFTVGVFAQTTPVVTTPTFTDVTNYVEVVQSGNATESGLAVTAGDAGGADINYVTINGTFDLINLNNTSGDPAVRYASSSQAIEHRIPMFVAPDPIINSGAWTYPNLTEASVLSTWQWSFNAAPTSASIVSPTAPVAYTGQTNRTDATYLIQYLNPGADAESYQVDVYEESRDVAGNLLCDDGTPSYIRFTAVDPPSVAQLSADDTEDCVGDFEDATRTLTIRMTGTAPFYIGLLYTRTTDPDGTPVVEYDFRDVVVSAAGNVTFGADDNGATVIGEDSFQGTATDNGNGTWDLTIPIVIDNDGTSGNALDVNANADYGLNGGAVTQHELEVKYINDRISRKSDRIAAVGSPDANPETHVLYAVAADAADMVLKLYPTPTTGNIFTLPN